MHITLGGIAFSGATQRITMGKPRMSETEAMLSTFPLARDCPFDPPSALLEAQQHPGPVKMQMWNGAPVWIFTRFEDVRAILSDNRFSTVPTMPGFPMLSPARDALLREEPTFIRMDPPDHGKFRRMVTKEFMVKRIDALRPRIAELVNGLIDRMISEGPPAELVNDFCLPLTSTVISEMLGVPYEDSKFFEEQSRLKVLLNVGPEVPRQASKNIFDYLDRLLTQKENDPGDGADLLSRLVIDQVRPGHLSHDDAVRMADLLLMAGHETTANQIALGTLSLLAHPEQKDRLVADPSLIKSAVDEMLRFHSIVHFNAPRVALEEVDVAGITVRKGEGLFALINAANRDPAVFAEPNKFDVCRAPDNHLAFSYGVHQCLGQPLARAELQTVFTTIFQRLPSLRLAVPLEDIAFKSASFVYGVETLRLTW